MSEIPEWLAAMYPFSSRSFSTPAGARMSYVDEGGEGDEAVLLLHGNPTWSFYYRRAVHALAPHIRCIAPDHIGMGFSEKPAAYAYTLESRIADIEALVNALGLRKVHLVVHDWGGAIGFGWAARHPELVGRIAILNTAAFPSPHIPGRIAFCRTPVFGEWLVRGLNGFAWPATWMAMSRRRLTRDEKRAYLFPYDSWANRIGVDGFVKDIPMKPGHPSWPTLERIAQALPQFADHQIMIEWGGKDFCFNDHFLARWREIYPAAACRRLADAGHYILEDAAEEVIPSLTQFLTK